MKPHRLAALVAASAFTTGLSQAQFEFNEFFRGNFNPQFIEISGPPGAPLGNAVITWVEGNSVSFSSIRAGNLAGYHDLSGAVIPDDGLLLVGPSSIGADFVIDDLLIPGRSLTWSLLTGVDVPQIDALVGQDVRTSIGASTTILDTLGQVQDNLGVGFSSTSFTVYFDGATTFEQITNGVFRPGAGGQDWCSASLGTFGSTGVFAPTPGSINPTCSGDPVLGMNYCMANVNSTGGVATISLAGSDRVADNDLTLQADGMPSGQFGLFVVSQNQGFIPGLGGTSNGNLCVTGVIGRFQGPGQIQSTGGNGAFGLAIDLSALPQGSGTVVAAPGQTWNFQAWYRDPVGLGSNLTNGIELTLR